MLLRAQNVIGLQVIYDSTNKHVFKDLARSTGEEEWSVIGCIVMLSLSEDRCDYGFLPVTGNNSHLKVGPTDGCQGWSNLPGQFSQDMRYNTIWPSGFCWLQVRQQFLYSRNRDDYLSHGHVVFLLVWHLTLAGELIKGVFSAFTECLFELVVQHFSLQWAFGLKGLDAD